MPAHSRPARLTPARLEHDLAIPDLSDPADGPHAVQLITDLAVAALASAWGQGCQVRLSRGPRVVPVADNYDRLGYDAAAVTREARYSRYVDDNVMLRSHSTALVPAALRRLAAQPAGDALLVCPGIAYRRDVIDWQHTGTPHQLDLWRVSRGHLTADDLDKMITTLLTALVPDRRSRQQLRTHPYTLAGRQVDVACDQGWVEVWECGLAHPEVLADAGLRGYTGLALGLGLDRLLMLHKHVPDIRLLRSADSRVAAQMRDLQPYRPVSNQPAIRRDLSIAVDASEDDETLGDKVREALGPDADAVEDVAIVSSTPCADLPRAALDRLGARPGQRNVLVRVVIRRLDRSVTDEQANLLRDRIYASLHAGSHYEWAAPGSASTGPG